jgi:hypothetical protein
MPYDRTAVRLPKGKDTPRTHPLLLALTASGKTQSDVARALKVTPQSMAVWVRRCKDRPNYLLPAERVPQLSTLLKVKPHVLRPDLYKPEWSFA